jgi:hypothetical protein
MSSAAVLPCVVWMITASVGWITELQASAASPVAPAMTESSTEGRRYQFKLTKGHGLPVCEAYRQRLNQTPFSLPPYCGRPESNSVPGFAVLQRVPLTQAEIEKLGPWVLAIMRPLTYLSKDELIQLNEDQGILQELPKEMVGSTTMLRALRAPPIHPWRYLGPIDINNNGSPHQVIVWDWDSTDVPCGGYDTHASSQIRPGQVALVASADLSSIDQAETDRAFGHPDGGLELGVQTMPNGIRFIRALKLIGYSYGIFEYRGAVFFDTFFDASYDYGFDDPNGMGDFYGNRKKDRKLMDTLAVFENRRGKTQQICEYRVNE